MCTARAAQLVQRRGPGSRDYPQSVFPRRTRVSRLKMAAVVAKLSWLPGWFELAQILVVLGEE